MADEFVPMYHPEKGEMPVRDRKVEAMEAQGWSTEKPKPKPRKKKSDEPVSDAANEEENA